MTPILILLFEIPKGREKNFLEICRQFGHATSETFISPSLRRFYAKGRIRYYGLEK